MQVVDASLADYFYVPLYISCAILPVYDYVGPAWCSIASHRIARHGTARHSTAQHSTARQGNGWHGSTVQHGYALPCVVHSGPAPRYRFQSGFPMRPTTGMRMAYDALEQLRHTLPYWNASGGKDHVFLFSHDEACCIKYKV